MQAALYVVTCLRKGITMLPLTVSFQPLHVAMLIEAHYVEFFSRYLSPAMHCSNSFFTIFQTLCYEKTNTEPRKSLLYKENTKAKIGSMVYKLQCRS
jgi:hypothetical protein